MNLIERIKNAYTSGGIGEINRKAFFHIVYRANNYITAFETKHRKLEFGLNEKERKEKIIVSLTSYPPRFKHLDLCLKSILLQDTKPDRIIVYLGSDSKENDLTTSMKELRKYGIEYKFDSSLNLKAHKKYFYSMQEFPDDIIITADDDLYYPHDWITSMVKSYEKYPNAVSARRVHLMKEKDNELLRYNSWKDQCRNIRIPSYGLFGTGGSGKLYPPHCLKNFTFDAKAIQDLCLEADDVWLKCMEVLSGIPTVWVKNWEVDQLTVEANQESALAQNNVDQCLNDRLLNNVMVAYDIKPGDFFDDI